ncbi:MAG TPA: ATP synthase F1 subunit epsilon [Candidatus Paceibacterota bacterium]|nr:ATP synthase F1 subunit epsilon [Verrucomicrobiota bacterium]HRY51148.1 ATP synthase F1 subunit epsilon [Candidatus Paceibacterota bacterium]
MAQTMLFEIVTPEGRTFSGEVEMIVLPGIEGELGIFPHHAPLVTQIVPGEIVIRTDGKDHYGVVGAGFVEITPGRVSIMTDMALRAEEVDHAAAEEARKRAEARLQEKLSPEEERSANAAMMQALAQLNFQRKHRG